MFTQNSKLFLKKILNNKGLKNSNQISQILLKNFNAPVPAGQGNVATKNEAPPKTKEQLKIEMLMEEWPECIRNPQTEELKHFKESLEYVYKFHQGDKNYLKYHEIPEPIARSINGDLIMSMSTENIAQLFIEKQGYLTDEWIIYKFYEISATHKDLSKPFFDTILPEVKKCIANSDRHCINILAMGVVGGANLNLGDREFWGLLVKRIFIKKFLIFYFKNNFKIFVNNLK